MRSESESYKQAGVDITSGYRAVELMREHIARTTVFGDTSPVGGFGGLFKPDLTGMSEPILVSGTDGVGTKIKLAFLMDKHDTIGIDAVALCVNDIICVGAKPLFFLDYIACGKNYPEKIAEIVSGVAEGCVQSECALIGGETAEHPGMMPEEEYDLAGFAVGIVDKSRVIDNSRVSEGDVVIGIASSGIHSNGFSLVRKVFDIENLDVNEACEDYINRECEISTDDPAFASRFADLRGKTMGEVLLTPTRIYVKAIMELMKEIEPHAIMHITGGGFYENIPRALPEGLTAKISRRKIRIPGVFEMIMEKGDIPERDMFNTYNMGIGMTVVVPADEAERAIGVIEGAGEEAYIIGEIICGNEGVVIE